MEGAILIPASFLKNHKRKIDNCCEIARRVTPEAKQILPVHVPKEKRGNFPELLGFTAVFFKVRAADGSITVGRNFQLVRHCKHLQEIAFGATADNVMSYNRLYVLCRCRKRRSICHLIGEVTVQEGMPQKLAVSHLAFPSAVVRNEEPDLLIGYQMQVAVKELG